MAEQQQQYPDDAESERRCKAFEDKWPARAVCPLCGRDNAERLGDRVSDDEAAAAAPPPLGQWPADVVACLYACEDGGCGMYEWLYRPPERSEPNRIKPALSDGAMPIILQPPAAATDHSTHTTYSSPRTAAAAAAAAADVKCSMDE